MKFIKGDLLTSAALCFPHRTLHGISNAIGVQNGFAAYISGSTADGLNQTALRAQEPLFIGIQNSNQRNLWNIQTFAQ